MSLKEKIGKQKIAGTMLRIVRNPAIMYLAKNAGLDFVMFDCEHSHFNWETLHDVFLTGNALGVYGLARVPELSKDNISRMLDAGACGIMVPMIETADQARTLVDYSKYTSIGKRGYTTTGGHTGYFIGGGKHEKIMAEANAANLSIAQIETKLGVENASVIAAVEGIDVLLIGPNDLSISLGIPGDIMNPIELEAIKKVADACKKHGKFFALHGAPAMLDKFKGDLSLVIQGTEMDFMMNGFKAVREYADKTL